MKKNLIIYILILVSSYSSISIDIAYSNDISTLLRKEINLLENVSNKNVNLAFRLFELYSEEIEVIKKSENKFFLSGSTKSKMEKSWFFKRSKARNKAVHSIGLKLLKRFPSNIYTAQIYYTLALNSRDFNHNKKTEFYLLKSLHFARDFEIKANSQSALADYYYNKKQYRKALAYYAVLIKNSEDEWLTKNLLNMAWCQLKMKKNKQALLKLKEVFFLSKKNKYINIQDQALVHLPLFFSLNEKTREGFEFFIKETAHASEYVLPMARRAGENGDYAGALYLINKTNEYLKNKNRIVKKLQVKSFELSFYLQFKKWNKHTKATVEIVSIYTQKNISFDLNLKEEIINQLTEFTSKLQSKLSRNIKADYSFGQQKIYGKIIQYFNFLHRIDNGNTDKYAYFQAESALANKSYVDSYKFYKTVINHKLTKNKMSDESLLKKSYDGLFFVLAQGETKSKEYKNKLKFVLSSHLELFPLIKRSKKLFPRYILMLIAEEKMALSFNYLKKFNYSFPKQIKVQRELNSTLLNKHIKLGNTDEISNHIQYLKSGFLKISKKEISQMEIILGGLLFKKYLQMENDQKFKLAQQGYFKIYNTQYYPQSIRAKAAFNMALTSTMRNEFGQVISWLKISFKLLEAKDLKTYNKQSLYLFQQILSKNELDTTYELGKYLKPKFCKETKKLAAQILPTMVSLSTLKKDYEYTKEILKEDNCFDNSKLRKLRLSTLHFYNNFKQVSYMQDFALTFKTDIKISSYYLSSLQQMYWSNFLKNNKENRNILKSIKRLRKEKLHQAQIKTFLSYIKKSKKITKMINELNTFKLVPLNEFNKPIFEEVAFNKSIAIAFKKIEAIKKEANILSQSKNVNLVVTSSLFVAECFEEFHSKLNNLKVSFTDSNYERSFTKQMKVLALQFKKEAITVRKSLMKSLAKSKSLSVFSHLNIENKNLRNIQEKYINTNTFASFNY